MRWLVYIFSCYLMVLSCLPCQDAWAYTGQEQTVQQPDDTHHPEQEDVCSPFCICACCSVQAAPHALPAFSLARPLQSVSYSNLYLSPLSVSTDNIWQPPRKG